MLDAIVTTPMNGDCPMPALNASPKVGSAPAERCTKYPMPMMSAKVSSREVTMDAYAPALLARLLYSP